MRHNLLYLFLLLATFSFAQCPTSNVELTTQAEIDAFAATYPGCTTLNVDLRLDGSDISDLSGLSQITAINGEFIVLGCPSLVTMDGLSTINFFGPNSELTIANNNALISLSNFTGSINTEEYSGLLIQNNRSLQSISGLSGITSSNSLWINNNEALTSITGVENMSVAGTILAISRNDVLTDITPITGNMGAMRQIQIFGNPLLTSLEGIEGVNFVTSSPSDPGLTITDNALTDLDPLSSITVAPKNISIGEASLTDISGLSNITGELLSLSIQGCSQLANLNGLEGISTITQQLLIINNDGLVSLSGLDNLQNLGESPSLLALIRENDQLADISAMSNFDVNALAFIALENNPLLATCNNDFICAAIDLERTRIEFNAPGCNSETEVQDQCALNISDELLADDLILYPNPTENTLILELPSSINHSEIQVAIYSMKGQLIHESSSLQNDVSGLSPGLYVVRVESSEGVQIGRFLKR